MSAFPDAVTRQIHDTEPRRDVPHTGGPKVLCAGLWRTGTSALQGALERYLDLSPCLHGGYMIPRVERLKLFYQCCVEEDDDVRRQLLAGWMDSYPAAADLPGWAFVEDLVVMYPRMRLVLNKRSSPEAWVKSVRGSLEFYASTTYFVIGYFDAHLYWHHQVYVGLSHLLQRRGVISDRSEMFTTHLYEAHNLWVRDVAQRYDKPLLEFELSDGLATLARSLNLEVPKKEGSDEDLEFPRMNEADEMRGVKKHLIVKGLKAWFRIAVGPLIGSLVVIWGIWHLWRDDASNF